MAHTRFKITELGQRTTVKVNALPAILDTWYLAADVLTIEKNNPAHYAEPFDVIKYKVGDDDRESNIANYTLNCPPNLAVPATSSNDTVITTVDTLHNLIDNIGYSAGVDRIELVSVEGSGNVTFDGFNVYPGLEVFQYDFDKLQFKSDFGTDDPYQFISYKVGNSTGYNPTVYTLKYSILGSANIELISETQVLESGIHKLKDLVRVINGRVNGTAKINIDLDLTPNPWSGGGPSVDNIFILNYNNENIEHTANFNADVDLDLSPQGMSDIYTELYIDNADIPVTGTITLTLLEINGDPLLVTGPPVVINVSI